MLTIALEGLQLLTEPYPGRHTTRFATGTAMVLAENLNDTILAWVNKVSGRAHDIV